MRVLVCGGRHFSTWNRAQWLLIFSVLNGVNEREVLTIIEGGAPGADTAAWVWAYMNGCDIETFEMAHGKDAGPIHNQCMIDKGRPDLIIAFGGGQDTADMVRRARGAGIEVREYPRATEKDGV